MARIRTVKPSYFSDAKVCKLSVEAELLYIGLWCFADCEGYLWDDSDQIQMNVFPSRPHIKIGQLIEELLLVGLLKSVATTTGRSALLIPNLTKHQRIKNESASFIAPLTCAVSGQIRTSPEQSGFSAQEGKGKEGKGREVEQNPLVGPPLPEQGTASAKRRGSGIPTNWTPSETLTTWANAKHPTVDLEAATEGFLNHAADKGRTTKSTDAAWRNWIIKAEDWGPHKPGAQLALTNGHHPHRDPNQANADAVARRMGMNPADTDPFGTAPDELWRTS